MTAKSELAEVMSVPDLHENVKMDSVASLVVNRVSSNGPLEAFDLTPQELASLVSPFKDHSKLAGFGGSKGIVARLKSNEESGLSLTDKADLTARDSHFGKNRLPDVKPKSLLEYMINALSDKIMILLSVVSVVSLAIGIYEDVNTENPGERVHWIEGFSVLIAVVIVVLASSVNDLQKEKQFRKLNARKEDRQVKGIRDGKTCLISIYDVLVGDVLLLEPGDVVCADGVFLSGMGLKCDESSATGEADAIRKGGGHDCFIVSGSKVTEGIGKYMVTSVGEHSFFGAIMMAMRTENEDTPLQVKLDGLAEHIAKLGTAFAILLFVLLFLKYIVVILKTTGFGNSDTQESGAEVATQLVKILLVSIAIVAVAVPEGLPLAVTLSLAYATTRMMQDNNLVRVLSACETMGNATTICSDKTGTLTQNRMTVVTGVLGKNVMFEGAEEVTELQAKLKAVTDVGSSSEISPSEPHDIAPSKGEGVKDFGPTGTLLLEKIMEGVSLNSSAFESTDESTGKTELIGSKTEIALLEWAAKSGFDYKQIRTASEKASVVQVYPFSSERKSMATLVKVTRAGSATPVYRVHVKGAPEIVMRSCDRVALLPFHPSPTAIKNESIRNAADPSSARKRTLAAVPAPGSRSNPTTSIMYPLDDKLKSDYSSIIESFALQSLRTICIAYREFTGDEFDALVNGPLRDRVIAAKKAEHEIHKEEQLLAANEGVIRASTPNLQPATPSPSGSAFSINSKNRPELRPAGSSMLMIPVINGGETKSFIDSQMSDDEVVTDADVLSHPLALAELAGQGLIVAAIVGIEDPLRPGVIEAVKACQDAGVFVRMVTGDNIMTAKSIATKCGIYQRGGLVMEGEFFRNLSDEAMMDMIPKLQVLARSSPLDKQILVAKLKALGETVAVTGDGTNDGPALKM
ncbi:UNVERIFIED_CONTAM: hypothetical protein HDU68_011154, partial [Siphonaria sp. JEL0065]